SSIAPQLARSGGICAVLTKFPHANVKKSAHGSTAVSIQSGTMPDWARVSFAGFASIGGGGGRVRSVATGSGGFRPLEHEHATPVRTRTTTRRIGRAGILP